MKRVAIPLIALLAAVLSCPEAGAQARGPAADEVRQSGQQVLSSAARQEQESLQDEALDDATRAARLADVSSWLQRLTGRFRIKGQVLRTGTSQRENGRNTLVPLDAMQGAAAEGIADCGEVGAGAGIDCAITAAWPFFEDTPMNQTRQPPAEKLNTMRPAVLMIGLNQDPLGMRAMMVPADSIAHVWVGKLQDDTAQLNRETSCYEEFDRTPDRCLDRFEIRARPDSDIVELQFYAAEGVSLQFILHRDPTATLAKPPKPLKAR
jgi:hypothetical protein